MGMKEWAEREVQIACKRENPDRKEGEWDYGCACYESALKAFNSLMEDGHSGASIGFTKQIVSRLFDGKPLTPIEDTEDVWNERPRDNRGYTTYQCKRMSSLFKDVYEDGIVKYSDVDRVICIDYYTGNSYSFRFIRDMVDEMFPITMPYSGEETYKVYASDFLYDKNNGDFDTIKIHYILKPDGEKTAEITVNRYFKESDSGFIEIDREEYMARLRKSIKREEK